VLELLLLLELLLERIGFEPLQCVQLATTAHKSLCQALKMVKLSTTGVICAAWMALMMRIHGASVVFVAPLFCSLFTK